MANAYRDENDVPTLIASSNSDGITPVRVYADPTTHRLLVDLPVTGGTVTSITGGTGILLTPDPIVSTGSVALATSLQPAASLTGNSLKVLRVNAGETAVEYATNGSGTVTDVSVVTANGVSGSVATSTTTPAITLTLGAITPTTVNGNTFTTGSSTYTGTAAQTYTFPTTTATIARTDAGQTFTGVQTMTSPVINTGLELGNASDTTLTRVSAGVMAVEGITVDTISATNTLTNKRITPRVLSASSYTTDTGSSINGDTQDMFIVTAQTGALKFNNPTGTPTDGQKLIISVASSTTSARALTWDTAYGSTTVTLPSTTTATTATLTIGFIWSASKSLWQCVAVA